MFTNSINHLKKNIHSTLINRITIITLLISILFTFNTLYFQSIGKGISIYSGLYQITIQSHIIELLLLIVGSSILLGWPFLLVNKSNEDVSPNARAEGAEGLTNTKTTSPAFAKADGEVLSLNKSDQYSLIAIFSILGGSLLMSSLDLLSMYLSIELQSFALYILATLNKERLSATSAGLKYFLLGSLSSCFILLGSAIIYSYTGLTQFEAINSLMSIPYFETISIKDITILSSLSPSDAVLLLKPGLIEMWDINRAFTIGLIIIIIGFLFKISAAPFYQWAPALCSGKTHEWVKLSNSGDVLKIIVLSYYRKIISGWTNYSGIVTSYNMSENEMDYRGSKSEILYLQPYNISVKEQRVDGSWFLAILKKARNLRYTLMGLERGYQIKIPSKQLNSQNFSFSTLTPAEQPIPALAGPSETEGVKLNPWFVTGFIDAEGCFQISIRQDKKYKTNWRVSLTFQIKLHVKDIALLNNFKYTFGVGTITYHNKNTCNFNVYSINEIQVIIEHCFKYPLQTQKYSDFLLFKQAFEIIRKGDHLTDKGLLNIVGLKSALNLGLSEKLKAAFLNFLPVTRPVFNIKNIPDPFWVAGFISGDGSFYFSIRSRVNPTSTTGNIKRSVSLIFGITLHIREKEIIQALASYFTLLSEAGEGFDKLSLKPYQIHITKQSVSLYIRRFTEIDNVIIPFFDKHPILGVKSFDFADFKKVAKIVKDKEHLTNSGFESIQKINKTMNLRRNWGSTAAV
jgi:hypothetical protein